MQSRGKNETMDKWEKIGKQNPLISSPAYIPFKEPQTAPGKHPSCGFVSGPKLEQRAWISSHKNGLMLCIWLCHLFLMTQLSCPPMSVTTDLLHFLLAAWEGPTVFITQTLVDGHWAFPNFFIKGAVVSILVHKSSWSFVTISLDTWQECCVLSKPIREQEGW